MDQRQPLVQLPAVRKPLRRSPTTTAVSAADEGCPGTAASTTRPSAAALRSAATRDPNGSSTPTRSTTARGPRRCALCALSDDGGIDLRPRRADLHRQSAAACTATSRSRPDGTVYVPNRNCGGKQGVVVSEDNGLHWAVRTVPGSTNGAWDPSVGIGADGTVYFGYDDGDGQAKVAVSHDHGSTWSNLHDIGSPYGILNSGFPAAIAGDAVAPRLPSSERPTVPAARSPTIRTGRASGTSTSHTTYACTGARRSRRDDARLTAGLFLRSTGKQGWVTAPTRLPHRGDGAEPVAAPAPCPMDRLLGGEHTEGEAMPLRDRRPPRWVVLILVLSASAIALGASVAATGGKSAAAKLHAPPPAWADPDLATVTSDNFGQQFTGAFTDLGCGSTDVIADPASTINVTVSADTPTNDLMVNLVHLGTVVKNEDTGVGQETFVYSVWPARRGRVLDPGLRVGESRDAAHTSRTRTPASTRISTWRRRPRLTRRRARRRTRSPSRRRRSTATGMRRSPRRPSSTRSGPRASPSTFVPGDGTILESGPWGDDDEQLLHPPLDQRRQGVPPRRRHGSPSRSATRRRRHGHRGRRPGNDVLQRSRGAVEPQHRGLERQRDDVEEEPRVDSEHAGGRPPVVRRGQRQLLVGLGQHDLLRVPPDGSRDVHLLVARLDRGRTTSSAASSGRTRERSRAERSRWRATRSARSSISTP